MNLVQKDENRVAAQSMFAQFAQMNEVSSDLANAIRDNKIKYRDGIDYIKFDAAGASGTTDLLKTITDQAEGISSFDKNRLPIQNARLVHKIFVGYGEGDGSLQSIETKSPFKAALATADLVVSSDGKEKFRAPVSTFQVLGSNVKPNERWYELDTPFLFPDNKEIKIQLKFADGTTLDPTTANDKCAVSVHFGSVGTFV